MSEVDPGATLSRARVLELLEQWEFAGASVTVTNAHLARGEEYLDLQQLHAGVQRATGPATTLPDVLPRKAVHEDTWRTILRQLNVPRR